MEAAIVVPLVPVLSLEEVFTDFLLEVSRSKSLIEVIVAAGIATQTLQGIAE